jgi:hypothetical protein
MLKGALALIEIVLGAFVELFKKLLAYALLAALLFASLITFVILMIIQIVR